ncbi:MAG: hypothetical protein DRQ55_02690 [Planctomycetota bacterium]|nr:MAG: hypothetical protein DRQ55_02690 [Planctomycetota bacterium]
MNLRSRLIESLKRLDSGLGRVAVPLLAGAPRPLPAAPDDALVVRLWGLGNLALMAPRLAPWPGRRLRLLTFARQRAFVQRHLPQIEALYLPEPCSPGFLPALAQALWRLHRDPPQVVIDAETFLSSPALLVRCATPAPLVGMDTPGQHRGPLLDRKLSYDPTRHVAVTFAALFDAAGLPAAPGAKPLRRDPERQSQLAARLGLNGPGPLVLLHPGSGDHFPGRRWDPSRFAELARALRRGGARVGITGAACERPRTRAVAQAAGPGVLDLGGCVDAGGLSDLLGLARLLVTNDTGPLHLADALAVPVVGLFGPNTPHRYGPRGPRAIALFADLPCSPCLDDRLAKRSRCRDPRCMSALRVRDVLAACQTALRSRSATPLEAALALPR